MSMVDPTIPLPMQALPPEARQAAYQQLLGQADTRYDRGDSSQMMADILNKVDMDRANRVSGLWANRNSTYATGADAMTSAVGAATAATRAKWAKPATSGTRRRGGGSTTPRLTNLNLRQPTWMQQYAQRLMQTPTYGSSGGGGLKMHMR